MHSFVYILSSVSIAALIGGITNFLAIKMLFHPRKPISIAGWRVPLTPGLIPKRKDEIARSLGEIVSNYLVTTEGLTTLLNQSEFQRKVVQKIHEWTMKWSDREETVEDLARRLWEEEQIAAAKQRLSDWLYETSRRGVDFLYGRIKQSTLCIADIIPQWSEEKKHQLVDKLATWIMTEIKAEVNTLHGERWIRSWIQQVLEQAGGWVGTLAGIFMDEEKLLRKAKAVIMHQLDSPKIHKWMVEFLYRKASEWEEKRLSEVVDRVLGQVGPDQIMEKMDAVLSWQQWVEKGSQVKIKSIIGPHQEWIQEKIPLAADILLKAIIHNMEKLMASIELPKLVEEQVHQFPVERVEQLILNVSGREFRAITWLGALLGGMIGLMQSVMHLTFFD